MLVKNWMSKPAIAVNPEDSMQTAICLLKENGELKGVVTDRDLKRASASDATSLEIYELIFLTAKIKVKNIMKQNPVLVSGNDSIERAANLLLKHKISGLPVKSPENKFVGVITQTDIFRVLLSLSGADQKGVKFESGIK